MKESRERYKQLLRCARYIQQQYEVNDVAAANKAAPELTQLMANLDRLQRQQAIAEARGWNAARELVGKDYRRQLMRIRNEVDSGLANEDAKPFAASDADLFRDLLALDSQFEKLDFVSKTKILAGNTKDIILDGHRFGAFRVVVYLRSMSRSQRADYEVFAVEPNRPSSNEDVTHPHVQCEGLCEGDAQPALKLALQQGRLFDFFQIVEQVLSTYNPSSAYVSLEDWEGARCYRCGDTTNSDDSRDCVGCEALICDGCVYQCRECQDAFCGNCDSVCNRCNESVCNSCLEKCSSCEEEFCDSCLNENERCHNCEKETKEESESGATGPEVHPDGLGKAAVPA